MLKFIVDINIINYEPLKPLAIQIKAHGLQKQ